MKYDFPRPDEPLLLGSDSLLAHDTYMPPDEPIFLIEIKY
jgi:hypothetical protein